jgi:hypothetical protein
MSGHRESVACKNAIRSSSVAKPEIPSGTLEWTKSSLMGRMYLDIVIFYSFLFRLRCFITFVVTWVETIVLPIFTIVGYFLKFDIKPYTIGCIPDSTLDPFKNICSVLWTHGNHSPVDSMNPVG